MGYGRFRVARYVDEIFDGWVSGINREDAAQKICAEITAQELRPNYQYAVRRVI